MRTRAALEDGEWVVNGAKQFITNAGTDISGHVAITARTGEGEISNIIVENGTPGYEQGTPYRKMGWNASDTRPLTFTDCRVPEENLLGPRGQGFKQFLHILDIGRIGVAAMGVGLAQGALDEALAYAKERRAFGQPISKFQAIQGKLADMATEIEAARLLTYKAAFLKDEGRNFTLTAAQAKLKTGRLAVRVRRGGRADPRRLRLHRGVPGVPLLPRRQDPHHRRGHRRGPADGHRPRARRLNRGSFTGRSPPRGPRTARTRVVSVLSTGGRMPRFSRARWIMVGACIAALSLAGAAMVTAHNGPDKVQVLAHQINDRKPKNVIMFLGDGMGDSEITAARYYYAGAGGHLRMDALPVHRRADDLVGQAGRPARPTCPTTCPTRPPPAPRGRPARRPSTSASRRARAPPVDVPGDNTAFKTVLELAQKRGMATGNVSTAEITDATPAVLASHISQRGCQGPNDTRTTCPPETKAAGGLGSIAEQEVDHASTSSSAAARPATTRRSTAVRRRR